MLSSFHVKGFLSCVDVRIDRLDPVTVLLGRNAAGKSNLLQAVKLMGTIATSQRFVAAPFEFSNSASAQRSFTADFDIDGSNYSYSAVVDTNGYTSEELARQTENVSKLVFSRNHDTVTLDGGRQIGIGETIAALPAIRSLLPKEDSIHADLNRAHVFFSGIRYHDFDLDRDLDPIVRDEAFKAWVEEYEKTGIAGESTTMQIVYLHQKRPDDFEELREHLGAAGLGLIDRIRVEQVYFNRKATEEASGKQSFFYVLFSPANTEAQVPGFGLSFGTRRVLRILVAMILDRGSVCLFEHPEDGIHRGLVKKFFALLSANAEPSQLIVSTHSVAVLDQLNPSQIRLVSMKGGKTTVRALSAKELSKAEAYIMDDGPLSDFIDILEQE
ncbi:MAG: AAA family ATPase [Planctomycetales bacterium]